MPSSTPPSCAIASILSHTPRRAQRIKVCAAIHHGPRSSGTARHFAPLSCRQRIAVIVRRRRFGGTFAAGRHASTSGSSTAQRSSESTMAPSENMENTTNSLAFRH